jgi:hypothetical protein
MLYNLIEVFYIECRCEPQMVADLANCEW